MFLYVVRQRFIMKKTKDLINTVAIILAGMILSSLWFTDSENWKWYLPICLTCLAFSQSLSDD